MIADMALLAAADDDQYQAGVSIKLLSFLGSYATAEQWDSAHDLTAGIMNP